MRNRLIGMLMMALVAFVSAAIWMPTTAHAQAADEVCTTFTQRALVLDQKNIPPTTGILSGVYRVVVGVVNDATERLYKAFIEDNRYLNALWWAMVLMVIFYAVGFMIGVVQPSFQQVLIRLVKIGIIFSLVGGGGWQFFNDNVVTFFQEGTDSLIIGVQNIATHVPAPSTPCTRADIINNNLTCSTPFYNLDKIADFIIQPDTIIAIMGAVGAGGPYGIVMGSLTAIAMFGFFRMLLKTLSVYAITYVARALVLGIAPIFFAFLLFDRTKNLFVSWLNALISLSLQPILLFTFLSFFIVMLESASKDMLNAELCWGEFKNISGSTNSLAFWRYRDPDTGEMTRGDFTYRGSLECLISPRSANGTLCKPFPINPVNLLSFLILVYLARRFADVVQRIAGELSNMMVGLDSSGKLEQIMHQKNTPTSFGGLISKQGGTGKH